jgi:small subunit ribosomal protein S6
VLLNIECSQSVRDELESGFRFNDAVLRHLIVKRDGPDTEQSPILKSKEKEDAKSTRRRDDEGSERKSDRSDDSKNDSDKDRNSDD